MNLATLSLLLCTTLAGGPATAATHREAPVTIDVRPQVTSSPGYVRVTAFVRRDPDNRSLTFIAVSGSYYRSSTSQLDGTDAARVHVMTFKDLPAGEYDIEARIGKSDGSEVSEHATVSVLDEEDCESDARSVPITAPTTSTAVHAGRATAPARPPRPRLRLT